jgi:hypothetical protein
LTDAEIKTLPSVPIILVPATETLNYSGLPSQLPLPLAFSVSLDTSAGGYGNVDLDARYVLALGSDWSYNAMSVLYSNVAQLNQSVSQIGIANTYDSQVQPNSQILPLRLSSGVLLDNALGIAFNNPGNLTDGNVNNSMKVTVYYVIADL